MNLNSLQFEKLESCNNQSRVGPGHNALDLASHNDSFNLQSKSPNHNLMITPSVHDFPIRRGKIKKGDFDNYQVDGDSESKHSHLDMNYDSLRSGQVGVRIGDKVSLKVPQGNSFVEGLSPALTKEPVNCNEDRSMLRSRSNVARIDNRISAVGGLTSNNFGPNQTGSTSLVDRSGSFAPITLQNIATGSGLNRNVMLTPKSTIGTSKLLASQAQMSTGKFGSRALFSTSPHVTDQNATKAIQGLQEQIQKLQKQLYQKEADYDRDKAIWDQKSQLADQAVEEMRRKFEAQKQQYISMIKLSGSDSPPRCSSQILLSGDKNDQKNGEQISQETKADIEKLAEQKADLKLQEKLLAQKQTLKEESEKTFNHLKDQHQRDIQEKQSELRKLQDQLSEVLANLKTQEQKIISLQDEKEKLTSEISTQKSMHQVATASNETLVKQFEQSTKQLEAVQFQFKQQQDLWTKEKESLIQENQLEKEQRDKELQHLRDNVQAAEREREGLSSRWQEMMNRSGKDMAIQTEEQQEVDSRQADQSLMEEIEVLKEKLVEKESLVQEQLQMWKSQEIRLKESLDKKDEIILCLTREIRINQTLHESLEQKGLAYKGDLNSAISNTHSDDKTDISVGGAGFGQSQILIAQNIVSEYADKGNSRKDKKHQKKHDSGIPLDRKSQISNRDSQAARGQAHKPDVIVDEVDISAKDSMVSFKDSSVSRAFVTQSKKSVVMEPPSFSQDIVGQQVTALLQKQICGKVPDEMKKCFQPESAGLPQRNKLGKDQEDNLKQQTIYNQLLMNVPKYKESVAGIKQSLDRLGSTAYFLSQNFHDTSSNCQEIQQDTQNESSFRQINQDNNMMNQKEQPSISETDQDSQQPIEVESSLVNDSNNNDCIEIDVPVCEKSQNDDSYYQTNNSMRRDNINTVEGQYIQQLQILEQKVVTRCQALNDNDYYKTGDSNSKRRNSRQRWSNNHIATDSIKSTQSQNTNETGQKVITIDTMTKNDDCMQYSESADVHKNQVGDITKRQIAIQMQIESNPTFKNQNSILLSDGFGSSDLHSNMLATEKQSDFTRIIPNDLTVYTRSQVDTCSNLPSSTAIPAGQNDSINFHQNFPFGQNAAAFLKDCTISEVALSQQNMSFNQKQSNSKPSTSRFGNSAIQLLEDQSLLALIKEIHLDESSMSQQNFLHNSQLLEKCRQQIENQKGIYKFSKAHLSGSLTDQQQFYQPQKSPLAMSLKAAQQLAQLKRLQQEEEEWRRREANDMDRAEGQHNQYDSTDQTAREDSIAKEFVDYSNQQQFIEDAEFQGNNDCGEENENVICTEDSIASSVQRSTIKKQKGYVFTFKKDSQQNDNANMKQININQQRLSDLREGNCLPYQLSEENIEQTNESMDQEQPQIQISRNHALSSTGFITCLQDQLNYKSTPFTEKTCDNLRLTPNQRIKHQLNDTIEPRIVVDKNNINLPIKSPYKNKFPDPSPSYMSANISRLGRGANSSMGIGNEFDANTNCPPGQLTNQRQLLFKGKISQGRDYEIKHAATAQSSLRKGNHSRMVPSLNLPEKGLNHEKFKNQTNSKLATGKHSVTSLGNHQKSLMATTRSLSNLDKQAQVKTLKTRTPSQTPPITDFQQIVEQQFQEQEPLATQRVPSVNRSDQSIGLKQALEKCRSQQQKKDVEKQASVKQRINAEKPNGRERKQGAKQVTDYGKNDKSTSGKLLKDLSKDIQVIEKLCKVQSMQSINNNRKVWLTGVKQESISSIAVDQTGITSTHDQSSQNLQAAYTKNYIQHKKISSNCLIQRRKELKESKERDSNKLVGFRKFDLDSVDRATPNPQKVDPKIQSRK